MAGSGWRELERAATAGAPEDTVFGADKGTLLELLWRPQETIPGLVADYRRPWRLPLTGYFLLSFAEGVDWFATRLPDSSGVAVVLAPLALALVFGTLAWAGMFGGAMHLSSRVLGGKRGVDATIRAVGYACFWPGLFAAPAALVVTLATGGSQASAITALIALGIQLGAGLWCVYTVTAALRSHHGFSWPRAVAAYLLPFLALIAMVLPFAMMG